MNIESIEVLAKCSQRGPWLRNSLKHYLGEMEGHAAIARNAFRKPHMGLAAEYMAEAFDKAAKVFDEALRAMVVHDVVTERHSGTKNGEPANR